MGLASSRCRRTGLQYCSRASHTGRQYCAVDSITISSTSRSTSLSASAQLGGIGPHLQTLEAAKADASVQRN
jgi:hypothetical protein